MPSLYIGDIALGKVNTGVFSENGYDTSVATATASHILAPEIAFNKDGMVVGNIESIPGGEYTANQTIPTKNKYLTSDIVVNVPPSGINPEGEISIIKNGTYTIREFETAVVNVPVNGIIPEGTLDIVANGNYNIKEYAFVEVNVPPIGFITDDATVTEDTLLDTVTAYGPTGKITGNIPVRSSSDVTINGPTVTMLNGHYPIGDSFTVNQIDTATMSNPTISVNADGLITATYDNTKSGWITAFNKLVTQQLTTQGDSTRTPGTTDTVVIGPGVYTTGSITMKGDPNLVPEKIKYGETIFGVSGSYKTSAFYTGSTVPSDTFGVDGDLYLRLE